MGLGRICINNWYVDGKKPEPTHVYFGRANNQWYIIRKVTERSWTAVCFSHINCIEPEIKASTKDILYKPLWDDLLAASTNKDMRKMMFELLSTGRWEEGPAIEDELISIESLLNTETYISCTTEDEADKLMEVLEMYGCLWAFKQRPTEDNRWNEYKDKTHYNLDGSNLSYASKNFAETSSLKIVKASEIKELR